MNKLFKKIELFVIVVIIAVIGIVYAFQQEPKRAPVSQEEVANTATLTSQNAPVENSLNQPAPETAITYQGKDGKSAMELLREKHQVTVKEYDFGAFVTSINGIVPDSNQFWSMYVNGSQSQVGASEYMTKDADTIKWQIDNIQ